MSNGTINKQLTLYGESGDSWQQDHLEAMALYDLEDTIALGLAVLARIERRRTKTKDVTIDQALAFAEWYRAWHETSLQFVDAADRFSRHGYEVDGLPVFVSMVEAVGVSLCRIESATEALTRLKNGEGISLKAVMDGLRHHLGSATERVA